MAESIQARDRLKVRKYKICKSIYKSEKSSKTERVGGEFGDSSAWNLVVRKLDYRSQMKIAQQNRHLAEVVDNNATHELQKYRRCLQEDKYL